MKKNISYLVFLSCLLIVVIFTGGCGRDDDTTTITIAAPNVGNLHYWIEDAAKRYQEDNPEFEIEFTDVPNDTMAIKMNYLQQFNAQEDKIDLYLIASDWVGDMGGHFTDLNEYQDSSNAEDKYLDGLINETIINEQLVSLPLFIDLSLLYYREDLLEKYGFSAPPANWQELEEMAEKIQSGEREENEDFWGYLWQGDAYQGLATNIFEWFAADNAGKVVDSDGEVIINNSKARNSVQRAKDWIGNISPPETIQIDEEVTLREWMLGNAAFMRNWSHAYDDSQIEESLVKDKFSIAPLPGNENNGVSTILGWNIAVNSYSEQEDQAADFLFHLASYQEQKLRAKKAGFFPTIYELYQKESVIEENPILAEIYPILDSAIFLPTSKTYPYHDYIMGSLYSEINSVLAGEIDLEVAFEYLELEISEIMEGYY